MEYEECLEKKQIRYKDKAGKWVEKDIEVPAAFYQCPDCGNCFTWVKGEGRYSSVDPLDLSGCKDLIDLIRDN
jgi:hypothetical protein